MAKFNKSCNRKITFLIFVVIIIYSIYYCNTKILLHIYPLHPLEQIECKEGELYYTLKVDTLSSVDWNKLNGTLHYISKEYDCSDFRLVNLIRIIYEYGDVIPESVYNRLKEVLADFRFWWDDEGGNSMCYWSENHQILFASAEYLLGEYFHDMYFRKAKMYGRQLSKRGKERILNWLELRWNYGFSEFYSNYYKEDIAALINLIDYSKDDIIKIRSTIILDLLFYDLASQGLKSNLTSVSSRAYKSDRSANDFGGIYKGFWADSTSKVKDLGMMCGLFLSTDYHMPNVFSRIVNDTVVSIVKQSNGLDVVDLQKYGLLGKTDKQLMMQFGMEAFINPEVIQNTIDVLSEKDMFSNAFLSDMRWLEVPLMNNWRLVKWFIEQKKPYYLGTALNKVSSYTYRTSAYSMYTAQAYQSGNFADQHHIFGLSLDSNITIYHTHPARGKENTLFSPNFWVGYGRLPYSVQDKNINFTIYNIPPNKAFLEDELLDYTYLFIPQIISQNVVIENNYVFVNYNDVYCAFIGSSDMCMLDNLIIQKGNRQSWITEVGTIESDGNFCSFMRRIKNNKFEYKINENKLLYCTKGNSYVVKYNDGLYVNDKKILIKYDGFDSPYIKSTRFEKERVIAYGGDTLFLNFFDNVRFEKLGSELNMHKKKTINVH